MTLFIISFCAYGQKENVEKNINESFRYLKKARSSVEDALKDIKNAYSEHSIADIQDYASKAKSNIDDAMTYAKKARNEARDAESEASNIKCTDAESNASYSENYFDKSDREFDDAFKALIKATSVDDKNELMEYIRKAVNSIEDGKSYLKKADNSLNDTLDDLNKCK